MARPSAATASILLVDLDRGGGEEGAGVARWEKRGGSTGRKRWAWLAGEEGAGVTHRGE
jgi:hypothetical protein